MPESMEERSPEHGSREAGGLLGCSPDHSVHTFRDPSQGFSCAPRSAGTGLGLWKTLRIDRRQCHIPIERTSGSEHWSARTAYWGSLQGFRSRGIRPWAGSTRKLLPCQSSILLGNLGRNTERGPEIGDRDTRLFEDSDLSKERVKLQFRMDFLIEFNDVNLGESESHRLSPESELRATPADAKRGPADPVRSPCSLGFPA